MVGRMIGKLADYIVSPLGMGTRVNYEAVKAGQTRLRRYEGLWGLPEAPSLRRALGIARTIRGVFVG